eukprot:557978-Alexandrium_andersonii.AAC.1
MHRASMTEVAVQRMRLSGGGAQVHCALVARDGRPAPVHLLQGGTFAHRALVAGDRRAARLRGASSARRPL